MIARNKAIHSNEEYKPDSNLRDHNRFNEQRDDPFTNSKVISLIALVNKQCKLHAVLHRRFVAVTMKLRRLFSLGTGVEKLL